MTNNVIAGCVLSLSLLLVLRILACTPMPVAPDRRDGATCEVACRHLTTLGCKESQDVNGTTCTQACDYYSSEARGALVDPGCLAGVKTCDQVNLCKPKE